MAVAAAAAVTEEGGEDAVEEDVEVTVDPTQPLWERVAVGRYWTFLCDLNTPQHQTSAVDPRPSAFSFRCSGRLLLSPTGVKLPA